MGDDINRRIQEMLANNRKLWLIYNSDKDELLRIETMLFFSDELISFAHLLNIYFIREN
jgi:hypothetical protein